MWKSGELMASGQNSDIHMGEIWEGGSLPRTPTLAWHILWMDAFDIGLPTEVTFVPGSHVSTELASLALGPWML